MVGSFELGSIVITNGIRRAMESSQAFARFVNACLDKYAKGNWGKLSKDDKEKNDESVENGCGMILGAYTFHKDGRDIWITTTADRRYTTILLPGEY